jgi:hypothetical protein
MPGIPASWASPGKKSFQDSTLTEKKLHVVAHTCHPSYSYNRKGKIEGSRSSLVWAKSKILSPKFPEFKKKGRKEGRREGRREEKKEGRKERKERIQLGQVISKALFSSKGHISMTAKAEEPTGLLSSSQQQTAFYH